jgi:hypothetical protein
MKSESLTVHTTATTVVRAFSCRKDTLQYSAIVPVGDEWYMAE